MVKKIIIRILPVFMLAAFTAVVAVQWLWIKYAIRERENKFTSQVYDVLNRVADRIDEINYIKYRSEMYKQLGEIRNAGDALVIRKGGPSAAQWHSDRLFYFLHRDAGQPGNARSYLGSSAFPFARSGESRMMDQELIVQAIRSMDLFGEDSVSRADRFVRLNRRMQEFLLRLVKEKDPENVSVCERLKHIDVSGLLANAFSTYDIRLPFVYRIMSKQDVLEEVKAGRTKNLYYVELFRQDLVKKGYYLGVKFKSVQPVSLKDMDWLFVASFFCIAGLMVVLIVTVMIIMRQQKLSLIKNDFINNMTHEFKTPIATISLATSALTKEKVLNDRDQILKFSALIKSENNRMNKYVERILQQARLDRREVQMNKVRADVNELVREAVEHFMLLVQEAGGSMSYRPEARDFILPVDEVHLMNAVCNLIDNAIKYSGKVPEIAVYTRESGDAYFIGVQDHGTGIPKEARKKVFKRFYRVPSGNVHNVKGFGLGLSYVKSVVELHGGEISLVSKKNRGTLVEIKLKKEGT